MKDLYMTAGQLKERLKNIPDDAEVMYQRIEDFYFNENNWQEKKLSFEDMDSGYIAVFSAYKHPDENVFVLNAHY